MNARNKKKRSELVEIPAHDLSSLSEAEALLEKVYLSINPYSQKREIPKNLFDEILEHFVPKEHEIIGNA